MRAVVVRQFGGPEQLEVAEVPDPVPGPGQVRVTVRAAGVNPVDAGNRADGSWAGLAAPCVLGYDIAGVVDVTGPGVTGWAPGDRVMAMTHFRDGAGGYAELAVLSAGLLARLGDSTSFTEAAATPLAAGTALEVLRLAGAAARRAAAGAGRQRRGGPVPAPARGGPQARGHRGRPDRDAPADARPGRGRLHRLHPRGRARPGPRAGRRPGGRDRGPAPAARPRPARWRRCGPAARSPPSPPPSWTWTCCWMRT